MTTYAVNPANNALVASKGPNMQVPPANYDPNQQNHLVNQLKLYHAQVDSNNQQLIVAALSSSVLQWISTGNG
jgi:hypothetical protein